jgi:hypothetical protein
LATLPILALLGFAVYDIRRVKPPASRGFVWALIACAALPLIAMDLFQGGHRTETVRYFFPLFLAIDLALAALIASTLASGGRGGARAMWAAVFAAVFVLRIVSCEASAHASSWWNSYNTQSREVAAQINRSQSPLVLSDDYIVWPLLLSEYLDPTIEVALQPRCYLCKLPKAAMSPLPDLAHGAKVRDVFMLAPSKQLQAAVHAQSELAPHTLTVNCLNVRGTCPGGMELWYVKN